MHYFKFILVLCFFFVFQNTNAQLGFCNGNSGDPIFTETFGVGTQQSALPSGTTTYIYANGGNPDDGRYTVSSSTNFFDWHNTIDHTAGDTNGKMLIVNSSFSPGEFYKTTINGLCENTTYEFSSWLLNLTPSNGFCGSGAIPINVKFEIWDDTDTSLLASGDTGSISSTSTPIWNQFALVFQTIPAQTSVILKMKNNGSGGCGNDLAIDDIVFKSCGDTIAVTDQNTNANSTICSSDTPYALTLTATPDNTVFSTHFYQWQESVDNITWTDMVGEINDNLSVSGINQTMYYRAKVAEYAANLSDSDCITFSDVYQITVTPATTPTFTQVSDICSGDSLSALPTTSNDDITGTWSPALDNTTTTTYTFTPDIGECATSETMTITVNPVITPTFTQVPDICSGDSLSALPTTSNDGITGTWSPALDNTNTTTYNFSPNIGECATSQFMTITVNPVITPTFTQVSDICSGDSLSALPTTSNESITGSWSPALDNTTTTTYTFTPDTGQCAMSETMTITVNPVITPTFTQVSDICSGDSLSALPTTSNDGITGTWSPALDNTTTTTYTFTPDTGQCAMSETMTIRVNPVITPTFTQVPDICSGDSLSPLPTTSNEGITGTWSPALNNTTTTDYNFSPNIGECATNQFMTITVNPVITPTFTQVSDICSGDSLSPLPTTSNEGITGAWSPALDNTSTTTYTFTPNSGGCVTSPTMTITVDQPVVPTFTQVSDICNGDSLSPLPTTSNEGITGSWSPALDNTNTTTYTFTPDTGQCATSETMMITVNPIITPTFTQIPDICSGDSLSPLPTTSNEGIIGTWSPALDNTSTTTYTFNPNAGECATSETMTITVNSSSTPTFTQVSDICSGDSLSPLPTTSNEGITGAWSPALDNTSTTTYTFTPNSGGCVTSQTMTITVDQPVVPTFTQVSDICNGDSLSPLPTTSNEGITGSWSPVLDNTETTIYTFTPNSGQCATSQNMTIGVTAPPVIETVTSNGSDIIITTSNTGEFEYSIDGINFQSSNIFYNVDGGLYTIYVKERNNCGIDSREHLHFIIPLFFTPNNDRENDTFSLAGIEYFDSSEVYIFNRFGKLLKSARNKRFIWDGTYKNKKLPSSDYWYVIKINNQVFKGHFTLKR